MASECILAVSFLAFWPSNELTLLCSLSDFTSLLSDCSCCCSDICYSNGTSVLERHYVGERDREDEDGFEKKRSFRALVHKCCSATPEVMLLLRGGKWLVQKWKKKKYQLHIASKMGGNHPRVISCKQSPMGQVAALDWMPQSAPARFSLPRSERRS